MAHGNSTPISGVLLGDQGSSSIEGSDKIYLLVDTNGDGDAADEGERIVFFDETNAEGLGGEDGSPTGNILNIGQSSTDGSVYAGDGDTDAVYRLKDLNGDGDANDAGEATVWFSEADNAAGFTLPTPNGIAEGPDGAIYIVNAGVSSRPADAIYRTVDLNGDGDANDEGEASVWLDLTTLVPTSSPYDLSFIGDRGYLIDPSGSAEDSIYTFADLDGSGTIEAEEFSVFATRTETGAPIDFTAAADGESIVVWEWLDRDEGVYSVYRLTDLDGSGSIDQADETVEIWNTEYLPDVFDTFAGFSIAADGEGRIAVTSNDSGASGDNVYILDDLNGDGDYFDIGETNVLASRSLDETTLERPRSLEFYEGPVGNEVPVAEDDAFEVLNGSTVTGNLFDDNGAGPDSDADEDPIRIVAVEGEEVAVGETITLASGALLTVQADGSFVYETNGAFDDLDAAESIDDLFTYTISDGILVLDKPFARTLDTSDVSGDIGTTFVGLGEFDSFGSAVSGAGDVNGDGIADLVIGANGADPNGLDHAGASYVVFGVEGGLGDTFDVSTLDGTNGFRISGGEEDDWSGISVSEAGDFNGDGIGDVVIAAHYADGEGRESSGEVYVVYGSTDGFDADISLASIDGTNGVRIAGATPEDFAGLWVNEAGDVNGDGHTDIILGAPGGEPDGRPNAGQSYVVFGKETEAGESIDLATLDGTDGFRLDSAAAGDEGGYSVSTAGDFNGDGIDDMVIGSAFADAPGREDAGATYVVFGTTDGFDPAVDLAALDGTDGFCIYGVNEGDISGISVSCAGDFNGDGFDDIVIGARLASPEGRFGAGESYVVYGAADGFGATFELSSLDGTNGVRLIGGADGDASGVNVSGAGDINGDGLGDVIIGAASAFANGDYSAGKAHVVFGTTEATADGIDLATLDGTDGFVLEGTGAGSFTGYYNGAAGDLDGDGNDDIVVGAPFTAANGAYGVGAAYVLYGRDTFASNTDTATVSVTVTGVAANMVVSAGNHFSLFLDEATNTVYAAGENALGQLGQGVTGFDIAEPVPVTLPEGFNATIVSVAAGMIHSSFLTEDGDVYVWGFGNTGRLGLGDEETRTVATKLEALDEANIVAINNGNGVSFAIDENGTLYGWGQNTSGQLGLGDEENRLEPTVIEIPGRVVAVSSGTSHTLALTAEGEVYGFGSNVDGQVGDPTALDEDGDPVREILSPVKVEGLPSDIVAVTADTQTSFAVASDGTLYGWGENSFGQLLIGTDNNDGTFVPTDDKVLTPVEIDVPGEVVDVKAGARWVAALTEDGDVYMWGPNDEGPSGGLDGDPAAESDAFFYPTKIDALDDVNIVEIETGPNHVIAVADDGTIHTFGSNADGRLGYPTDGSTYTPETVALGEDIAPYLLSAEPADNGRDVAPDAAVVLTFTENVFPQPGEIRFVNRDTGAVLTADVTDPYLVRVVGNTVTVVAPDFFTPDGAYAVEIDEGAFVDEAGQDYAGIAEGDTSTFNFSVADTPVEPQDLSGTNAPELYRGGSEDDRIVARGGADKILVNGGDDNVMAGQGDDTVDAGAGNDMVNAGPGNDEVLAGSGDDTVSAGTGDDTVAGGDGDDSLMGRRGSDHLMGEDGDDTIEGGGDRDLIEGGAGNDSIHGQGGNDVIDAGSGNDFVQGGSGNDTIVGGDGDDTLNGQRGEDVFEFDRDDGNDVIVRFRSGEDVIRLDDNRRYTLSYDAASGDSQIAYGDTTITVRGVELTDDDIVRKPLSVLALTGIAAMDNAGISAADAGDVNGDGYADTIIGAFSADRGDTLSTGAAYIAFGGADLPLPTSGGAATASLANLSGRFGVTILGEDFSNLAGWSVSSAGDVDGDGLDDVIVGAFGAEVYAGRSYVLFGSALVDAAQSDGVIDLATLDKSEGVILEGSNPVDFSGYQVASLGDLDGDGKDDIVVGAGQAAGYLGEAYVVFGSTLDEEAGDEGDGFVDLGLLSGEDGVTIRGAAAYDILGFQVSDAGDVDGDDVPDVVLGGWTGSPDGGTTSPGIATVVYGSTILAAREGNGLVDTGTMAAEDGVVMYGIEDGDAFGRSVSDAGDIDGDGYDELLVGSYLADAEGAPWTGEVYLLDGASVAAASADGGSFDVADLSGGRGVAIIGSEYRDLTGFSVAATGDVDGGGTSDILIGAYGLGEEGGAYLLFGEALADELAEDGDGVLDLATLTPDQGVVINGIGAEDVAGYSVSGAGDVDGDGLADIVIGAWEGDLSGETDSGEAYIISGAAIEEASRGTGVIDLADLFVV